MARGESRNGAWAVVLKPACRGCGSTTRKLLHPGPRCGECHRAEKKRKSLLRKDGYQRKTYGITQAEKEAVIEEQDGGCICAPWTNYDGSSGRDLSTDHDHETGIVRGVLCKHCNDLLGRIKDDPTYFRLMIRYLENPPAVRVLGERLVPE